MAFSVSVLDFSNRPVLKQHGFKIGVWGLATGLLLKSLACCDISVAIEPSQSTTIRPYGSLPTPTTPLSRAQWIRAGWRPSTWLAQVSESSLFEQEQQLLELERQQEIEHQVQQELIEFTTSADQSDVIVLGQPQNFPYVVVIPGDEFELLREVQEVVPTAFMTSSRRGRYIYTASFPKRRPADALNAQLRHLGFDAQVTYMPTN